MAEFKDLVAQGIPDTLPDMPEWDPDVNHAPARPLVLDGRERRLAVANALRYFPPHMHAPLAEEFTEELLTDGRIYMRRFRPTYAMHARPIDEYPARCREAAAIMLMITNNLDPEVAQHPHELVTYGGNGTVFQNWAQYLLAMRYLSGMTDEQTLVLYSGHPLGLFPSRRESPRLVLTCGMMVPEYSTAEQYARLSALGVTSYGQMTAGSFMYIGPQGIVHGTTITLLNAGRRYLGIEAEGDLRGVKFVTSGLGGMSGAQAKAAVITGATAVIAEVNPRAAKKRLEQGWVLELEDDLDKVLARMEQASRAKQPLSLAYVGNIVDLWERLVDSDVEVELGSDQTSLHIPFTGGYYPAGLSLEESNLMMRKDPQGFKERVQESLRRQVAAIHELARRGLRFWDYGNAFLLEAGRAGAAGLTREDGGFVYPSYVEDIMGPMCFDHGFGPFRWVCTSGDPSDLVRTDEIAARVIEQMLERAPDDVRQQLSDNLMWIRAAGENALVVGSQARILYSNAEGRIRIARAFNEAVRDGTLSAPVVLGRDHHDVGGTDSPYRETANIYDGSSLCADMAVHNFAGDAFRGATWVSLHNGGGTGWGQAVNGGFGMVLDGSPDYDGRIDEMMFWDVNNGIARRAWAGNEGALDTARRTMEAEPRLRVTLPSRADPSLVDRAFREATRR
jgi:urocanate hydratase